MEKELEVAKKLGLGAGRILMDYYQRDVPIDWKAPGDPVTVADRAAKVQAIGQRHRVRESIRIGSVGLKVGIGCEGRAHVYVHPGHRTHLWDTCGPEAILREAGGRMTGVSNTPLRYDTEELRNLNGIVVTNGVIHDRVIEVTQAVLAGF